MKIDYVPTSSVPLIIKTEEGSIKKPDSVVTIEQTARGITVKVDCLFTSIWVFGAFKLPNTPILKAIL